MGLLGSLFTSKREKDITLLKPLVIQINQHFRTFASLTDDQLRDKTADFKRRIQEGLATILEDIAAVEGHLDASRKNREVAGQEALFAELDKLKKARNTQLEKVLMELLPEAFAVVKETCRRFTEQGQLRVKATDHDRQMASRHDHVQIEGDTAIWLNNWEVAGHRLIWNMVHYDVQLMGGIILHQGKISEMATGEGKTLVSTLPAYLNALAGYGVHLVTVNDYLAKRDAEWNAPIFQFHGISVDCIDKHEPHSDERADAYRADIVYGTNNEFGFDYLRDNMVTHPEHLVQRELHYAMIDEVDSVLVDEARTPLIISGPVPRGDKHEFNELKPLIERLVTQQRRIVQECLNKARTDLSAQKDKDAEKEAGLQLLRSHRGLPKYKPLIKFLSEDGTKVLMQKVEAFYMQDNSRKMHVVDDELCFTIDEKNNQIELTDKGLEVLAQQTGDRDLFVLPDITSVFSELEGNTTMSAEERLQRKEELSRVYAEKSERLHSLQQLLKAYCLFEKDTEYIVEGGKVMIVDENTGRVLPGRRYSDGLHQAIEAKENVKVEAATQTFATVTLQNFFRMYHKLCGMTGTAETEAAELYEIYKLDVVVVPTNRPIARKDYDDKVYKTKREKYNAIIDEVKELVEAGRPVLVGTTSVESSELLSRMMKQRGIAHNVLNAKQHEREAEIVAEAGLAGKVTIATNMAGRGTDIKLGPGVKEAGGLAIIGSERHESRRIDRQLRGRAGRQGDPGSSQFFVSLEDDLMRMFRSERIAKVMDWLKLKEGEVIQHKMITRSISNAQKKVEENNFAIRKRLLEYDDVMNKQREVIYTRRRNALFGDRIQVDMDNMVYDVADLLVQQYHPSLDAEGLRMECLRTFAWDPELTHEDLESAKAEDVAEAVYKGALERYRRKNDRMCGLFYEEVSRIAAQEVRFQMVEVNLSDGKRGMRMHLPIPEVVETHGWSLVQHFEKNLILTLIDDEWKEHLREMDDLKQSVQTAVYEQKDPLLIYKFAAFDLFQTMMRGVNEKAISLLWRAEVEGQEAENRQQEVRREDFSRMRAQHANLPQGAVPAGIPVGAGGVPMEDRKMSRRERRAVDRKKK
ncbi:MAG: preprotein translocase subunit SecA [Bacteroidetes bacterium]|nr:preprotein translocase subunit SecA [Bacteroidota bacterium]